MIVTASSRRCSASSPPGRRSRSPAIRTVRTNLFEGGALVLLVLLVFLGNVRAALIVAAVIPLSMLIGFIGMRTFGVSANLMSLGAIDFGMIVDGAVVMMENSVRHLRMDNGGEPSTPAECGFRKRSIGKCPL